MKRAIVISEKFTNSRNVTLTKYLNEISRISLFETPEDEYQCALKMIAGDPKAKDEMVSRNLRFVVSVAKKYENAKAPLMDLINQGNIGLLEATKKFDPNSGFKFITYAVWQVRKEIMDYLNNNSRTIRVPMSRVAHISRFNEEVNKLTQRLGKTVTAYEMYDELDGFTNEEIDKMLEVENLNTISYDKEVFEEVSSTSLVDILESNGDDTDHLVMENDYELILNKLFSYLNPKQAVVIKKSFGLENGQVMTLHEIGSDLGITRERVRQIKDKALRILQVKSQKLGLKELPF